MLGVIACGGDGRYRASGRQLNKFVSYLASTSGLNWPYCRVWHESEDGDVSCYSLYSRLMMVMGMGVMVRVYEEDGGLV